MNLSDRFLSTISETTEQGNDPKKVASALRHFGAVLEEHWPFTDETNTFEKFHEYPPQKVLDEGKKFLEKYEIGYEWINTDPESLMDALKYSPLGVAVEAWRQDDSGYYIGGENPNHWTILIGYSKDNHWIVFDSYPETSGSYIKLLRWDYKFALVMSYSLNKKKEDELQNNSAKKESWFIELLRRLFGDLRGEPF